MLRQRMRELEQLNRMASWRLTPWNLRRQISGSIAATQEDGKLHKKRDVKLKLKVLADRGYFSGSDSLACELAAITTYVPNHPPRRQ